MQREREREREMRERERERMLDYKTAILILDHSLQYKINPSYIFISLISNHRQKSRYSKYLQSSGGKKTTNYIIAMQFKTVFTIKFDWKLIKLYNK